MAKRKNLLPQITEICDGDYDRFWYFREVIDADHPTYLVLRLQYMEEWCGSDFEYKYHMEILACGPKWPTPKNLQNALDSYELSIEDFKEYPLEGQLQLLVETGLAAHLWQSSGNNWNSLVREAREAAQPMFIFFGCYMDKHQNAIGDTGWDWIRGNLCAGIERYRKEQAAQA